MQPGYIEYDIEQAHNLDLLIQNKEIIKFLDDNIHAEHRENYLRLKHGEKITKNKIVKLQKHIEELMENSQWAPKFPKNEDN